MKIAGFDFKYGRHGLMGGSGFMATAGKHRLIVRPSVVKRNMWCAESWLGKSNTKGMGVLKRDDGRTRRDLGRDELFFG